MQTNILSNKTDWRIEQEDTTPFAIGNLFHIKCSALNSLLAQTNFCEFDIVKTSVTAGNEATQLTLTVRNNGVARTIANYNGGSAETNGLLTIDATTAFNNNNVTSINQLNYATATITGETIDFIGTGANAGVVGAAYKPCTINRVRAGGVIQIGAPLKPSITVAYELDQIVETDSNDTPVIAIAIDAALNQNDIIRVTGVKLVSLQADNAAIAVGAFITFSSNIAGRVEASLSLPGVFAIAAEPALANAFFDAWLYVSEVT